MKKLYFILVGIFLLIIIFLIMMSLLGYKFNKNFISYDRQECIEKEYPTYYGHSGIAGCIFWMRHDDLERSQSWAAQYERDEKYCKEKYNNNSQTDTTNKFANLFKGEYEDSKCEYAAFQKMKRNENWDYLTSKEKDGFYDYCVNQKCPKQSIFK